MKRNILGVLCLVMCANILVGCTERVESGPVNENVQLNFLEDAHTGPTVTETTKMYTITTSEVSNTQKETETLPEVIVTTTSATTMLETVSTTTATAETTETTTTLETTTQTILMETLPATFASTSQATTTTTVNIMPVTNAGIKDLPYVLQQYVDSCMNQYPGLHIGCGIFSLDGTSGYGYNLNEEIYSACTIKAPYAMYVLSECQKQGINIWQTKIMYTQDMYNGGSGIIKDGPVNTEYSIGYLLSVMLKISDNSAYNVLVSRFGLYGYQEFLRKFGGQNLYGSQYGRASANQRKNEWVEILKYINTGSAYAQVLKEDLTGVRAYNPAIGAMQVDPNKSQYCYLVEWMKHDHEYLHKSGWSWGDYMSACDCAVIDNQYIIIMMTADYATGLSRTDILRGFGSQVEAYVDSVGGAQYLFS